MYSPYIVGEENVSCGNWYSFSMRPFCEFITHNLPLFEAANMHPSIKLQGVE